MIKLRRQDRYCKAGKVYLNNKVSRNQGSYYVTICGVKYGLCPLLHDLSLHVNEIERHNASCDKLWREEAFEDN